MSTCIQFVVDHSRAIVVLIVLALVAPAVIEVFDVASRIGTSYSTAAKLAK